MPTIEEQTKEAENRIKKLYEDIAELESERSGIQNELTALREAEKKKSDEAHLVRMAQLEETYHKKQVEQDTKQKYLDDYMVRLDKKEMELTVLDKSLKDRENNLAMEKSDFEIQKNMVISKISDEERIREKAKRLNEEEAKRLATLKSEIDKSKDSQEITLSEINARYEALSKKEADIQVILAQNEKILENVSEKERSIKEESEFIKETLDAIDLKKQELIKLSAIKDDLLKLDNERQSFEQEKAKLLKLSKDVESRDNAVTERETTSTEKEKYLMLREREVDGKIALLRKIRAGDNV